jgi:hypothetical protein
MTRRRAEPSESPAQQRHSTPNEGECSHDTSRVVRPVFIQRPARGQYRGPVPELRAAERYRALVQDLGALAQKHIAQTRELIRKLVGEIRLAPTTDGYLEAVMPAPSEGALKLVIGGKLNNLVAGEGIEPSTFGL